MSGDVQPRKRKNKGKKKGDAVEEEVFIPLKNSTDEVIHVHKDIGCGGNVFTKLIFFFILATIGVMVGVILLEYRGSSDEETISATDSPWSVTFQHWVDDDADKHHAHDDDHSDELEDYDGHSERLQTVPEKEHIDHAGGSSIEGDNSIFSWFSFWREGFSEDVKEPSSEETEGLFDSLLDLISFGTSGTEGNEEVDSVNSQEEESSGGFTGWFGFGEEKDLTEKEVGEVDSNEIEDPELGKKEEEVEYEEDEDDEENKTEEVEDIDQEEEKDEEDEIEENDDSREQEDDEIEENNDSREHRIFAGLSNEEEDDEGDDVWNNLSKPVDDEDIDDQGPSSEEERELVEIQKNEIESEDEGFDENSMYEDERNDGNEEEEIDPSEEHASGNGINSDETGSNAIFVDTESLEEISNEEELFPEAKEALRREREELAKEEEQDEGDSDDEGLSEKENEPLNVEKEEETEGIGEDPEGLMSESPLKTEWREEMKKEIITEAPVSKTEGSPPKAANAHDSSTPGPATPTQDLIEESPAEDEETGDEEEAEDEEESELEIDKEKFKELIAKYGQNTPESSDIEPSDEEIHKYSGGEESAGDEAEEESPAEVVSGDEPASEDELKEWTGIKKSDIKKITRLDSESEGDVEPEDEEEEESDDEPSSVQKQRGGPKDFEELYPNDLITNEDDWAIREELDRADEEFNYEKAHSIFTTLLEKHPDSPRARYGIAYSLDSLAEAKRSNKLLEISINSYFHALAAPNIPDNLYIKIATRLINRLRFRGLHLKAIDVHNLLIKKFLNTPEYRNELAITYLIINDLGNAKTVLKEVLKLWPEDPFALAHYGLVLKLQGNVHGCIKYLEAGIKSELSSIKDSRLFFHLGDALTRIGRALDAEKVYDKGVAYGLFRSRYQRSLYNVDHLTSRPWWTHEETTYSSFFKMLEDNWVQIRDEGLKALKKNVMFLDEAENLRDKGDWKQFELFARGSEMKNNCEVTPFTCSLIRSFEPAARCKRGQSKFSIMEGGTHVWPHCGPTNCRLRAHLGLIVPEGPLIRVANTTKKWEEGKVFVFDDSFEHEVWHNGSSYRLVLIVDVWHPELTKNEKFSLSPI